MAKIDQCDARFVTRLKANTPLRLNSEERFCKPRRNREGIIADAIGHLSERLASCRKNPSQDPARVVTIQLSTGKILRLVTNDLDAPAEEITDLYKQRWQIDLFFKWIKQNLKIRHFLGRSENAVRIQIFVALIAHILLRLGQSGQQAIRQPLAFARLVRLNIMERRSITALKSPPQRPHSDPRQLALPLPFG